MQRSDFRFFERLRVRWAEIDAQKIVFNGHYLMYFDTAVAGYWRALAMPYAADDGAARRRPVRAQGDARIPRPRPVYDDVLDVGMRCARVGNSSIASSAGGVPPGALLVSGELIYVFADPAAKARAAGAAPSCATVQRFEAGESMVDVRVGSWRELEAAARPIRAEVFVGEQKIPAEMEWDDADADAVHAVAFNRLGRALGTGRHARARARRRARSAGWRCGGLAPRRRRPRGARRPARRGARARRPRGRCCMRRLGAAPFYRARRLRRRGAPFEEAGIAHVEMARSL